MDDHFDRHGEDFNAKDAEDYAKKANEFYMNKDQYEFKIQEDGTTLVYDYDTNTFGAYNSDGTAKTYFKPTEGADYFDRKPGW